jgi:uncharacterized protein YyaL (SSP411 family)
MLDYSRNPRWKRLALSAIAITVVGLFCSRMTTTTNAEESKVRKPLPSPEEIAKLPKDGGKEFNRLIFSSSPYLLQHARNPVDWHPWGEEAFELARKEGKAVFLSVGYSTCHWCHVMEHESFEDEDVAKLMNEHFVCVKVDREERPDIDQVYMTVTQLMTGSGGWPMTVVMTPDKEPFFAGTYFPKNTRGRHPGMVDLVPGLAKSYKANPDKVAMTVKEIKRVLGEMTAAPPGEGLGEKHLLLAYEQLAGRFDPVNGGFGRAPKFPVPHNLRFLLGYGKRSGEKQATAMAEHTLRAMRKGGVYDHVGFGFHRYSTDAEWLVPHFEKMLYDQALLAMAYTDAYHATGKQEYADTAREILTYVLRDMTGPDGGFYSAEDADAEGVEGKFTVWTLAEVEQKGGTHADLYGRVHNLTTEGNYLDEATHRRTGSNIPHLDASFAEIAKEEALTEAVLRTRLESVRKALFTVRETRIHPLKDDKVLTDWNGLMIAAFARAADVLGDQTYRQAAVKAGDNLLGTLRAEDGRLFKRSRLGKAGLIAHLEDYAFAVQGLIELYQSTFDSKYLQAAVELQDYQIKHFTDDKNGGFYMTADSSEKLLVRSKEIYDGAIPSGNSVSALNLLRLERMTGKSAYGKAAEALFKAFSTGVERQPSAHAQLMLAVDFFVGPSQEVVIVGKPGAPDTNAMIARVRQEFHPNRVIVLRPPGDDQPIAKLAPYTANMAMVDGKATAYVCRNFACELPATDLDKMVELLRK